MRLRGQGGNKGQGPWQGPPPPDRPPASVDPPGQKAGSRRGLRLKARQGLRTPPGRLPLRLTGAFNFCRGPGARVAGFSGIIKTFWHCPSVEWSLLAINIISSPVRCQTRCLKRLDGCWRWWFPSPFCSRGACFDTACGLHRKRRPLELSGTERSLHLRRNFCHDKRRLGRAFQVVLAGLLLLLALRALFGWPDAYTLTMASFLTFHLRHSVSQVPIARALWIIEALIWIFFAGFVMTWLLVLSNPARPKTLRDIPGTRARSVGLSVFLTGLLSAVVFGGASLAAGHLAAVVQSGRMGHCPICDP